MITTTLLFFAAVPVKMLVGQVKMRTFLKHFMQAVMDKSVMWGFKGDELKMNVKH